MGLCLYIHSKIYIPQPDTLSTVNTRPVWYLHCNCFHLHKFSFYTITPHPNTGMHQDSRVSKYYKVDYFRQFFNVPQFRSACNFCGTEREREREREVEYCHLLELFIRHIPRVQSSRHSTNSFTHFTPSMSGISIGLVISRHLCMYVMVG